MTVFSKYLQQIEEVSFKMDHGVLVVIKKSSVHIEIPPIDDFGRPKDMKQMQEELCGAVKIMEGFVGKEE